METVIEIDNRRTRLKIKKYELCAEAGIKPEMLSYTLRRGRDGESLPADCLAKINGALDRLEKAAK